MMSYLLHKGAKHAAPQTKLQAVDGILSTMTSIYTMPQKVIKYTWKLILKYIFL